MKRYFNLLLLFLCLCLPASGYAEWPQGRPTRDRPSPFGKNYSIPPNRFGANSTATIGQYWQAADSPAWEHPTQIVFGFCEHVADLDSDDACMITKANAVLGNAEWGACMILGSGAATSYIMSFYAGGAISNFARVGFGGPFPQNEARCFMASVDLTQTQTQCVYSVPNPVGGTPGSSCTVVGDCPGASVAACSINQNRIRIWISRPGITPMTLTYATSVSGTIPSSITSGTGVLALGALVGATCIGGRTNCTFGSSLAGGAYFDQPWAAFGIDRATATAAVSCLYPNGSPTMTPWACFPSGTQGLAYWMGDGGDALAGPTNRWPCGGSFPACGPAMLRVGAPTYQLLPY